MGKGDARGLDARIKSQMRNDYKKERIIAFENKTIYLLKQIELHFN
jgi:hypothetical protein